MDTDLQKQIAKVVNEVYQAIKNHKVIDNSAQSPSNAAQLVWHHLAESKVPTGIGLEGDPNNKAVRSETTLETQKRIALLYFEVLLNELKAKDPTPPKGW